MQANLSSDSMTTQGLNDAIDLLSTIEDNGQVLISFFVDLSAGESACEAFLQSSAEKARLGLSPTARFEFDHALRTIRCQLRIADTARVKGLAVYARGFGADRFTLCLPTTVPFENRLTAYRVPDTLPLLNMLQHEVTYMLLHATEQGIDISEHNLGHAKHHAWIKRADLTSAAPFGRADDSRAVVRLNQWERLIRKVVMGSNVPLALVGNPDSLTALHEALPQRALCRIAQTLPIPFAVTHHAAAGYARAALIANVRLDAAKMASRALGAGHAHLNALIGEAPTLVALHRSMVDTLIIAQDKPLDDQALWNPKIELSRIARRQGVRIVQADSAALNDCGGIACLLHQQVESVQNPSLPIPRYGQLDLVA
ncbi:hypothetical protein [Thiosocius teredinicola]|uniref:hypothetical protein n=1 Tax=Thiosocius teredinicola TaxID=1973002 RepID=UPI000F77690E